MGKILKYLRANVSKAPADVQRRGLGLWFQVLEDRFMALFWSNLMVMICLIPFWISLLFYSHTGDWLSLALTVLTFGLAAPAVSFLFLVCMQAIRGNPIWVWQDLIASFRRDWKKSIPLGLAVALLWAGYLRNLAVVLGADRQTGIPTILIFAAVGYFLSGFSFLSFQQLATVELPLHGILRNGLLLIFAGKLRSFFLSLLTLICICLIAWFGVLAWTLLLTGVLAILILTGELIFFPVFEDLFLIREGGEIP